MPDEEKSPGERRWLERSLDRWYVAGIACLVALLAAFPIYALREPGRLARARASQRATYVAMGAKIFAMHCTSCHGEAGGGGRLAGPTLRSKEYLELTTAEQTEWAIAGGRTGTTMAAWSQDLGGALSAEEVKQVVAFVRSFEGRVESVPGWKSGVAAPPIKMETLPTSPPDGASAPPAEEAAPAIDSVIVPEEQPALVAAGQKTYQQFCVACHGPLPGGAVPLGPVLYAREYLEFASNRRIDSLIVYGVPGTAMIGWSKRRGGMLDDAQVRSLVFYVRSLQARAPSVPTWRNGRRERLP